MGRLIAFDQPTASALVANTKTAAQLGHGSPLKAALSNEGDATLLMRASDAEQLLVVNVRRLSSRPVAVRPATAIPEKPPQMPAPRTRVEAAKQQVRNVAPPRPQVASPAPPPRPTAPAAEAKPTSPPAQAKPAPAIDDMEPVGYEATGFLGLKNSPLYTEDLAPKPKKKWWQKLLD
jgi:hypothetical protein